MQDLPKRPFVGRKRELVALAAALEEARAGRTRVVMLVGEPGAGKTRTATEFAELARQRDCLILWARGYERTAPPPYWLWTQALRSLAEGHDPATLCEWAGDRADEVGRLIPALRELGGAPPTPSDVAPEGSRLRFFDGISRFLRRASEDAPLVLLLDDLHAADLPSLLLLEFAAREVTASRVLVVGTCREAALRGASPLAESLSRIAANGELLPLRGLRVQDIVSYVTQLTGVRPSDGLVAEIAAATGGNPLFLSEVVRLLSVQGQLAAPALVPATGPSIPREVRHAIHQRLLRLSPECRRILAVAAVIGDEPGLEVLEPVAGAGRRALLAWLEEATQEGLLVELPSGIGRFRFAHGLVRETLGDELAGVERAELHARVGQAMEALYEKSPDPPLAELARHFFQAARLGDTGRAVHYAASAGARAMEQLAFEPAVEHYERALEVLGLGPHDPSRQAQLLIALGDAIWRTGSDPKRARDVFAQAAQLAEALGSAAILADAAARSSVVDAGTGVADQARIALLEKALAALDGEPSALRVKVQARLAAELYFTRERERCDELAVDALRLARELGDPAAQVWALFARHFTLWGRHPPEERLPVATEMIRLGQAAGRPELALEGYAWQLTDLLELGDLQGFDRELEIYARRGAEVRVPRFLWHHTSARACRALLAGDLPEAERLAVQAFQVGYAPEPGNSRQYFGLQILLIRRAQGRLAELEAVLHQLAEEYPRWRCARALLRAEIGRPEDARLDLESLALRDFEALPPDGIWLPCMALLADACHRVGDAERAADLYARMLPYAERNVVVGTAAGCLGSAAHFLGLLAATAGRLEEATAHFEQALCFHERIGASILLAYTQAEYALLLDRRGASGDARRAAALSGAARATAERLGLRALLDRLEGARQAVAPPRVPPSVAGLRCEGDYWTLRFRGPPLRIKDRKGLRYLAVLLEHPDREFHALDLTLRVDGRSLQAGGAADELPAASAGGLGALLDARALADYQRRLLALEPELEAAERNADLGRAAALRGEREFVARELSRAFGLGGRPRPGGSPAERARVNVTRAIRSVLKALDRHDPELGRLLETTVSTGLFCCYRPDPRFPMRWEL